MNDRQKAGVFSLIAGLILVSLACLIYIGSGVSYRSNKVPQEFEAFLVLYFISFIVYHLSMIGGTRMKWLNIFCFVLSMIFFVFITTFRLDRSGEARFFVLYLPALGIIAWTTVSAADFFRRFDEEKK